MQQIIIYILLLSISVLTTINHSNATTHSSALNSISIKGTVNWSKSEAPIDQEATIQVYISKYPFTPMEMSKLNPLVKVERKYKRGSSFLFNISPSSDYVYMNIIAIFPNKWRNHFYSFDNIYILRRGDKIDCKIGAQNIKFSGRGSNKLNIQSLIFSHYINEEVVPNLLNNKQYALALNWQHMSYDTLLKARLMILIKNRKKIDEDTYFLLKTYCIADRYFQFLYSTRLTLMAQGTESEYGNKLFEFYFKNYFRTNLILIEKKIPQKILFKSPIYANYLLEKSYLDVQVIENFRKKYTRPRFEPFYTFIKNQYNGKIRDQLIILCYLVLRNSRPDALDYLQNAMSIVSDSEYKNILQDISRKEGIGENFYNFSLQDSSGKIVKLNNFPNKVLVLDFWYSGCENCIVLRKAMSPIFSRFSDNSKVSFVSVSIDKDKQQWINSLNKGLYTDNQEINLYTNGSGLEDPLIKYYNITAFPRQFIIVNGKMYESIPPIPDTNSYDSILSSTGGTIQFIRAIENGIKLLR